MKGLLAAVAVLLAISAALALDSARVTRIGDEALVFRETPHPVTRVAAGEEAWVDVFTWPKASYIAVHFSKFDLAPGERVVVRTPDGKYSYTFLGEGKLGTGGEFWATHVPGETCELHYYGSGKAGGFGYVVDMIAHGFPAPERYGPAAFSPSQTESICGADDSNWAKCYEASEPQIYDRSRAIARITIAGTNACTAWLVGCQGHILTNNHCIGTNADAMDTDYEFMAEGATCATDCASFGGCPGTIVSSTGTLIATEAPRDFSLVLLPVNPTSTYGYFRLRSSGPTIGERIYIPGHPGAWGKRFAVASTDPTDPSGFCQVRDLGEPSCIGGGPAEVGYHCDTQGGSSGSPVVAYSDQKVVALHHCGGCPNTAVSSVDVIAGLGASLPQCAVQQFAGTIELLQDVTGCSSSVNIRVRDDNLAGAGTLVVTLASTTEAAAENVTLTETPAGSGTFLGSFPTTASAAVHGDGHLSVANGDTITGTYIDADDGQGGQNVPRTDTASADCAAPIITNVQATNVTGNSAVITWMTNEPATSRVTYGTAAPPGTSSPIDATLVTSHSVLIEGLTPCVFHYFSVTSRDGAGNSATVDNDGAFYTFTTGQSTTPSFTSTDTPLVIPDNNATGVTSTITVPDNKTVQDVDVKVNIAHTYDGDLVLTLISPIGQNIALSSRRGGSGDNLTNTVFNDEAAGPISGGTAPFTGSFRPESPLSVADGLYATGAWKLKVVDAVSTDTGTLLNWTLSPTYPPQTCGPHAKYGASALVSDTCSTGGTGSSNGTADAGEQVRLSVTLENDGSVPLTGVTATLTPLTAGVTMVQGTASYNTIAVGGTGTSLAPHFTAQLPTSLACGSSVSYQLAITTAQGNFSGKFTMGVGRIIVSGGTPLSENFSGGIPGAWTVVNGGTGGGAAATWTTANPGSRLFTAPISSPAAIVDSDNAGNGATQDEQLITPVMNLASATTAAFDYDEFFRWYSGGQDERGDVDVRSSLTGGVWVNVVRNQGAPNPPGATTTGAAHRTVNITAQAAGAADVQVRFHYYNASFEWWWEVDNVVASFTAPGGCNMTTCFPPGPPPVPDGTFGTAMTASKKTDDGSGISVHWDVSTCAATNYHLLYGPLESVGGYQLTGGVCGLGTAGSYDWTVGPGGGSLWFVVVADDGAGIEGSWGTNSSGGQVGGSTPSMQCGKTSRNNSRSCP